MKNSATFTKRRRNAWGPSQAATLGGRRPREKRSASASSGAMRANALIDTGRDSRFPCIATVGRSRPREVWQTKRGGDNHLDGRGALRSEEHTSELQSLRHL